MSTVVVAALYHFVRLDELARLREWVLAEMLDHGVRGTILIANEGINGTIAGSRHGIDSVLGVLQADRRLAGLKHKESYTGEMPFRRTKVRLKEEIVSLGVSRVDPTLSVGRYVSPAQWNQLISDPTVTVIDARNKYEVEIGTFEGAVNPHTDSFRQFSEYVEEHLDPAVHKKIAMFCTGGIRCEKATSYLLSTGFEEVYHLEGGILKYLEDVPETESLWRGECFVFDDRVAVDHDLNRGNYELCHACRMPLSAEDMDSPHFVDGASCPHCHDKRTDEDRARYLERQRQMKLAEEQGCTHLGPEASRLE